MKSNYYPHTGCVNLKKLRGGSMKIAIIGGAGLIGSTAAYEIGRRSMVDEICLIDVRQKLAKAHQLDMEQAIPLVSKTRITSGDWEALTGSDLVIITVGKADLDKPVASRMERLKDNLTILTDVCHNLKQYTHNPIIINVTNPLDVLNTVLQQLTGIHRQRILGLSLNDTYRFRWALAHVLAEEINAIEAYVLGEHGEEQCPICSQIYVNGKKINLTIEQKEKVLSTVHGWFKAYQSLHSGRTAAWLSAISIADIVEAICHDTGEVLPCSVIDEEGISLGRLVRVGREGIKQFVPLEMNQEEEAQFERARQKVMQTLKNIGYLRVP